MYFIFSYVTMTADVMAAKNVFAVAFPVILVNPRTASYFLLWPRLRDSRQEWEECG